MVKSLEEFENGCIAMLCTVVRSAGDLRPYTLATKLKGLFYSGDKNCQLLTKSTKLNFADNDDHDKSVTK